MILNVNNQTELSGFYVIYNRTIANEKDGNRGITHLIEHLINHNFNDNLVEEFQNAGLTWNAYTSSTNIVFYLNGLDKYVNKYKYEFLKRLSNINTTELEFQLEKKVILEEYTSIFNIQSHAHLLNLYRKLINSYSTIGYKNDIKNLTLNDCKEHFDKHYKHPSKIINVSKNSPFVEDVTFNNFTNDYHVKYENFQNNDKVDFYKNKEVSNKSSLIYLSPIIKDDWDVIFFINYLLSNGIHSPLYKNIRGSNGLAYYIRCSIDRMSDYSGINIISTETDDDKIEQLITVLDNTLSDASFLTRNKFEQVKNSIINKIETVDINRYCNVETFIKPSTWSIESNIHNITYDKIIETYEKYYNIDNFYKSVDKSEFN